MSFQKNVLEYLENAAEKFTHKIAVTDEKREETFGSFRHLASAIGTAVSEHTAQTNSPIAVFVDRDLLCLAACMGALYSGNFYVPIDNKMPKNRLERLFEQLNPSLILYREEDARIAKAFSDRFSLLSIEAAMAYQQNEAMLTERRSRVLDIDPVYVIYTSGSTGTPKGIVVSHRSVIDFIEWMAPTCGFSDKNVMGNQAPFYFDASVKDIYLTMKCCASMHILPQRLFSFPIKLVEYLDEKRVNTLVWATSGFNLVANSGVLSKKAPSYVKKLAIGGEAMLAKNMNIWRHAIPDIEIYNIYGPTEVTVDCTYYKVERDFEDHEAVPIGKACENKEIFLLDENLRPVKAGESGEICVRGIGVAKGYYNDFEKTEAVFVQNPLNPFYPDIIYRTGDIARLNEHGELVFQSRADGQIKHMGYRIELGEIERVAGICENVKAAVCFYDEQRGKIVCVYEGSAESGAIIRHIKDFLPKYMMPGIFRAVKKMPQTSNGKLDRKQLKEAYFSELDSGKPDN